ncbi:hypothetical protein EMIT079MI2_130041 [Bacillus sp. IT-79MI2]
MLCKLHSDRLIIRVKKRYREEIKTWITLPDPSSKYKTV